MSKRQIIVKVVLLVLSVLLSAARVIDEEGESVTVNDYSE